MPLIRGLQILHSSISGSRDLWWPADPKATLGYNVYRALDAPLNWLKLTPTPLPGQYFRDETKLTPVRFIVPPDAYIDAGEMGQKCVKLPDVPYAEVVKGRPSVAASPDDITVEITDETGTVLFYRPQMVSGLDQTVWLPVGQALPLGGAVSTFPIIDFTSAVQVVILYRKLVNYVDITTNMVRTFYTVVPVNDRGEEHLPGAYGTETKNSMEVDQIDYMLKRMVECNAWLFEQQGEPAYLMFRRRCGQRCGCAETTDATQGRTACPVCYETGIIGGYYGPIDVLFQDPDAAAIRTIDEGGTKVERQSRSYLSRTPIVQDGDMFVRHNGERLVISGVVYKMPRGVLVQQDFNVSLLNPKDTRYLIPIAEPENPIIYNPARQPSPRPGAEPVYQPNTVPGKHLEYPKGEAARTIAWGRIRGGRD